jgi:hypothetical protein
MLTKRGKRMMHPLHTLLKRGEKEQEMKEINKMRNCFVIALTMNLRTTCAQSPCFPRCYLIAFRVKF